MENAKEKLRYFGLLTFLISCAIVLALRLIYQVLADPERFPINTIKIAAVYQHITHKELESVLNNYLPASFFSIPVNKLKKELLNLDWTADAAVKRIWPDTLKITLQEKEPIAAWNEALLTKKGEIFNEGALNEETSLPHLYGPANQQQEVLQVYQKLSKILSIYGLHAASLAWRNNQAWELILTNGVHLRLGKKDLETRLKRFCKAFPAVFAEKTEQLASVDLRYPRGMAVQWKN